MLKCHNDGKEKWQSFEVWDDRGDPYSILTGYGSTVEVALTDYRQKVAKYTKDVNELNEFVQTTSEVVMVDYGGNPLKGDVPI